MSGVMLYFELATPEVYTDLVYQGSSIFADGTPVVLPINYQVSNWGVERVLPVNGSTINTAKPTLKCKYSIDAVAAINTHTEAISDLYTKVNGIKEELVKPRETVNVTATVNHGNGVSSAVVKILVGGSVVAQGTHTLNATIAYGTEYTVEAERVYDYLTPASQTFTAGQAVRNVTMAYTYIERDQIMINQEETDETAMITKFHSGEDSTGSVIDAIRSASHLYLGTQTEDGNQLICQLKDDDGTKYADGTSAALDGTEGDQWMKLPVFWWKVVTTTSGNSYTIMFALSGEPGPTWHKWEGDRHLVGVHKMYVSDSKGYSRSNVVGTVEYSWENGKAYARARGTGYTLVTWEWHCMMAALFYAKYGRMDAQTQCGTGSNSNTRTLGTNDSLGMTDTTSANGNADNTKFWGIENWWGDINEWMDNITSEDYALTVIDHDTGQSRSAGSIVACGATGGYTDRMAMTEMMDFVPSSKGGTSSSSYCDWVNSNTGSRVLARSHSYASAYGGVACVGAFYGVSSTYAYFGSRLAFSGEIEEAESVAAYKAVFV